MPVNAEEFRAALGRFASGVTVVCCAATDGRPLGVTVSAFTSVSLDPPLVLFCLDRRGSLVDELPVGHTFTVNILHEGQENVSRQFAARHGDRFANIAYHPGLEGTPVLDDVLTALECRVQSMHAAGDHDIFIGLVERVTLFEREPLVHCRGRYAHLARS